MKIRHFSYPWRYTFSRISPRNLGPFIMTYFTIFSDTYWAQLTPVCPCFDAEFALPRFLAHNLAPMSRSKKFLAQPGARVFSQQLFPFYLTFYV